MEEYVIKLTPRMKDSLKSESLNQWLVKAESECSPYWTHALSEIIEQVCEQNNVTPLPYNEEEGQTLWLR